ncbi:hypothetical protein C8J57DRAFT_1663405 [Mycena rebaudengoi]|nr:hypothetical protein C8J57DRAFT_1663405 [Mycena rebaudengoi]
MSADLHDPSSAAYKKAKRQYLNSTRKRPAAVDLDWTPFRAAEKRFKARFPPPDLSTVLDLALLDDTRTLEIQTGVWKGSSNAFDYRELAPKASSSTTKAYTTPRIPGALDWFYCLGSSRTRNRENWCDGLLRIMRVVPTETNLDIHYVLPEEGLWTDNFLALSATPKPPSAPSPTAQPIRASALLCKLRWANIGWYYHWGTKQYDFTKGKGKIDDLLRDVCQSAVNAVDWNQVYGPDDTSDWGDAGPEWMTWSENYEPDAGIVNFYQTKDTLMAHVDRSEVCATSPLVSISLGNAAVFLIGGLTRDTEPVPILLRSGDAVIMSGPACRRAYHGVPRILDDTLPAHLAMQPGDSDWQLFAEYMQSTRININVRQVFPKGFDPAQVINDSKM